ncbi:MAG TPA: cytochrome c [Rhizomicrobium sp.]|nr:cytochrome c [Rhizomicrobium sp.]
MKKLLPRMIMGTGVLALVLGASQLALRAQAAAQTVWSGVFTADQAAQGKTVFENKCLTCHGAELNGGEMAPPLSGAMFLSNWTGQSLGDLFTRIHTTMPQNDPGSLNNAEVAQVMAYILSFNQFPAGTTPLPSDEAALGQIGITDKK